MLLLSAGCWMLRMLVVLHILYVRSCLQYVRVIVIVLGVDVMIGMVRIGLVLDVGQCWTAAVVLGTQQQYDVHYIPGMYVLLLLVACVLLTTHNSRNNSSTSYEYEVAGVFRFLRTKTSCYYVQVNV